MADSVDKFGISLDLDVSGLQSELIKAQNELRKFHTQLKSSTDTQEINKLSASISNLDEKIAHLGSRMGDVKKPTGDATQSLVNLSRIAQDAPYGFMGIANNLNPMLESFQRLQKEAGGSGQALKAMVAGLSGPAGIGVALGVGSSLIVAFGSKIDEFVTKLSLGTTYTIQYADALKGIGGEFTGAVEKVSKVENAFNEYHKGILTGTEALKIYNDSLGKNLGIKSNINEAEETFKNKTKDYIEASYQRALADSASKKAAEELLKVKILESTGGEKTGELGKMLTGLAATAIIGPLAQKPVTDKLVNLYDEKKTKDDIAKGNDLIANYKEIARKARELSDEMAKRGGIVLEPEKEKKAKKQDVDTSALETLKMQQKLYEDDLYMYREYADKIALEQKKINLEKAKISGASNAELLNIEKQYGLQLELNEKQLGDNLTKLFKKNDDEWVKKEKERNKKLLEEQTKYYNEKLGDIQDKLDIENKLADKDFNKKKAATKNALDQLKALSMGEGINEKSLEKINEAYKKLEKNLKLLDIEQELEKSRKLDESYKKFAETVSKEVTNGLVTMWDALQKGESPLQAIGDMLGKIVEQLIAAVAQAAIFQGIMMILNPEKAGDFGTGFIKKLGNILGFAEGGIVSQPTIAMVGEGGQSEAIMPLNKLGNMINSTFSAGAMSGAATGGGGGQFTLRGSDLVLALNRSNYSLNLRRGA